MSSNELDNKTIGLLVQRFFSDLSPEVVGKMVKKYTRIHNPRPPKSQGYQIRDIKFLPGNLPDIFGNFLFDIHVRCLFLPEVEKVSKAIIADFRKKYHIEEINYSWEEAEELEFG